MTDTEIERLAELVAIKVNERYLVIAKDHIGTQINLHAANCVVAKTKTARGLIFGAIGGIIVAIFSWILSKL